MGPGLQALGADGAFEALCSGRLGPKPSFSADAPGHVGHANGPVRRREGNGVVAFAALRRRHKARGVAVRIHRARHAPRLPLGVLERPLWARPARQFTGGRGPWPSLRCTRRGYPLDGPVLRRSAVFEGRGAGAVRLGIGGTFYACRAAVMCERVDGAGRIDSIGPFECSKFTILTCVPVNLLARGARDRFALDVVQVVLPRHPCRATGRFEILDSKYVGRDFSGHVQVRMRVLDTGINLGLGKIIQGRLSATVRKKERACFQVFNGLPRRQIVCLNHADEGGPIHLCHKRLLVLPHTTSHP